MRTKNLTIDDIRVSFYDLGDMCLDEIFLFFDDFEVDNAAGKGSALYQDSFSILSSGETYSSVSDFVYFDVVEEFGHFVVSYCKDVCKVCFSSVFTNLSSFLRLARAPALLLALPQK